MFSQHCAWHSPGRVSPSDTARETPRAVPSSSTSRNQSLEHEVKALLISVEFNALGLILQRWHMFASGREGTAIPSSNPEKKWYSILVRLLGYFWGMLSEFGLRANLSCNHMVRHRGEYSKLTSREHKRRRKNVYVRVSGTFAFVSYSQSFWLQQKASEYWRICLFSRLASLWFNALKMCLLVIPIALSFTLYNAIKPFSPFLCEKQHKTEVLF